MMITKKKAKKVYVNCIIRTRGFSIVMSLEELIKEVKQINSKFDSKFESLQAELDELKQKPPEKSSSSSDGKPWSRSPLVAGREADLGEIHIGTIIGTICHQATE